MTFIAWLVPQLNASTFFFTLARFFSHQAITCPSPLLSTSKPFLAIFTYSNHRHILCWIIQSFAQLSFHFNVASFEYETIPYAIPYVSIYNSQCACFHMNHRNLTIDKPLHEFHLHCCLVFDLHRLYNNTSFWLYSTQSSTCEIINFLSNT